MERALVEMIGRTDRSRVRHAVCTIREPGPLADALPEGTPLHAINAVGRDRFASMKLAAVIRRTRPDVVHARNPNTWFDCRVGCRLASLRPPAVLYGFHGLETESGFAASVHRRVATLRLRNRAFTTVSDAGRRQLIDELKIPAENIRLLPNGVDTARFAPPVGAERAAARGTFGIAEHETVFVTIASLVPVKDHATTVDALAAAGWSGPVRWIVVGDGPLRGTLEEHAARAFGGTPVRVTFAGERPRVRDTLRAADVFILTSRYEQMSNALLEACACGLPTIVANVGDNARIVENEKTGLVVPAGDVNAAAVAVARLADDSGLRRSFGEAARRRMVDRFEIDAAVERYVRLYESVSTRTRGVTQACAVLPA